MLKKILLLALFAGMVAGVSRSADLTQLPNPLKNLKEGQWVLYNTMGAKQKQTVSKIEGEGDDRKITVTSETIADGKVVNTQEQVLDFKDLQAAQDQLPTDAPDTTITQGKYTVGDREIDVHIVEVNKDGAVTKIILSEAVPVSAMVKMEMPGVGTIMEVEDFGE